MTKIEWTDATWNPIVGCSIVSPGCTNCYAMKMAARLQAMAEADLRKRGIPPGAVFDATGIPLAHFLPVMISIQEHCGGSMGPAKGSA